MELAIILLNWNAADDTIRCIQQIVSWKRLQPAIWVVDNASTDGGAERIARDYPEVHLIRSATNLGYAGGNNRALTELLNREEPILLLNNDALIDEDHLMRLLQTLQNNPPIGLIGPLLFDARQPERLLTAGGRNIIRHLTSHISREFPERNQWSRLNTQYAIRYVLRKARILTANDFPRDLFQVSSDAFIRIVDYAPGTALLVRAEVFQKVGLLDEAYFFSGELPDLSERARRKGFLSAVDTRARAYHAVNRSSEFRETLYVYYIIRNRFLFIRKFCTYSKLFFYSFWTLYSLALAAKVRLQGKPQTTKAVQLGLWDGLRGRFGGQNERVLAACEDSRANLVRPTT